MLSINVWGSFIKSTIFMADFTLDGHSELSVGSSSRVEGPQWASPQFQTRRLPNGGYPVNPREEPSWERGPPSEIHLFK